jgi:hypothetical protein
MKHSVTAEELATEPTTPCVDCGILMFDSATGTQAALKKFGVVVCPRCGRVRDPEWPKEMGWPSW